MATLKISILMLMCIIIASSIIFLFFYMPAAGKSNNPVKNSTMISTALSTLEQTLSSTSMPSTYKSTSSSTLSSTSSSTISIIQTPTGQCTTPSNSNYSLQYETAHWYVYAYNSTWDAHKGYYLSQMGYLDQVYDQLSTMFGVNPGKLYLMINQQTGGGFATSCISAIGHGPGIGIAYDAWYNTYSRSDNWSIELIAHESTNVFTGHVVSGWPRDWWADDKSPFPFAIKILIERATGHFDAASASTASADTLTRMFLNLENEYPGMYERLFANVSEDSWTSWFGPNPSQDLSDYVAAYLSIASGAQLTETINTAFVDEGGFNYTINPTAVNAIIARRFSIERLPKNGACWAIFRSGNFDNVSC